jgi:hypothetical protein
VVFILSGFFKTGLKFSLFRSDTIYTFAGGRVVYIAGILYTEITLLVVVVAMMQPSVFKGLSFGFCLANYQYINPV